LTNSNLVVEYYRNNTPTLDATCSSMTAPAISTSQFIKYACSLTTTSTAGNTTAFLAIRQADSVNRNLFIDSLAIIAQTTGTQNVADVQVGGINGQGLTLLTLDTYASKPFTGTGNTALLGSMYYDTTAGRIQCYESDGWGSCGAAPNNNVTFIAEYGNAVIAPPPGVTNNNGTMTASLCSGTSRFSLNTTVCAATEEFNYYQWTSTQATAQQYSIYAKYQLPPTFNGFVDDNTIQMTARTTNTTNGSVKLSVWGNTGTQCGSTTTITSSANTWQTVSLTGNETGCGFVAGDVITFRVDMSANSSAQVFASNISFTMTGK
ncbi:MAG TPA: hypothetical protein VLF67_01080, partial [Candidatus Saccharimonas sp.]|nr:hypothetical protein [Candidatus Saccharimonas sp.]